MLQRRYPFIKAASNPHQAILSQEETALYKLRDLGESCQTSSSHHSSILFAGSCDSRYFRYRFSRDRIRGINHGRCVSLGKNKTKIRLINREIGKLHPLTTPQTTAIVTMDKLPVVARASSRHCRISPHPQICPSRPVSD